MPRTAVVLILAALAPAAAAGPPDRAPASPGADPGALLAWWRDHGLPPRAYVVSRFEDHDWVFLGEYHRIRDDVTLVRDLIPDLHRTTRVRRLALEFLRTDRTADANALITAETFDRGAAIDFFREQFPDWGYEEYLDLFRTAWESNRAYAADRGPFLLAGLHPGIDWEAVNYSGDPDVVERELAKRDGYDAHMARALEEQVLDPGEPALVFCGIAHATAKFPEYRQGTEEQLVRMGNLVRRGARAERMFFIALHAPFWDAGRGKEIYPFDGILDRLMLSYHAPVGFDVVGTPFAGLVHENRSERAVTWFRFGELYDGYIMHGTPLKETVGATCIPDWIETEGELRFFARHLANKEASATFSSMSLQEFLRDCCAPRPDHGILFRKRFRDLPDLTPLEGTD